MIGEPVDASTSPIGTAPGSHLERYAVVIGIDRYQDDHIPNLRFACRDAERFRDALIDPVVGGFNPDDVLTLLDEDATEYEIETAIGTWLPAKAGRDALVVLYYSGHGAPAIDPSGATDQTFEEYLVPTDGESANLRATGIAMKSLPTLLGGIKARQVVLLLDCCYSGEAEQGRTFPTPDHGTGAPVSGAYLDSLGARGRVVITACDANEVALEDYDNKHGVFTRALIDGLRGRADASEDGLVTTSELYEYVYPEVRRRAHDLGGEMNPLQKGSLRGRISLTARQEGVDPDGTKEGVDDEEGEDGGSAATSRFRRLAGALKAVAENRLVRLTVVVLLLVFAFVWGIGLVIERWPR